MSASAIGLDRLDEFLQLPFALHRDDPAWVPPLVLAQARELASTRYVRAQLFLRPGEARVAALVNPRLGPEVGQLGYFEATDLAAARDVIEAGLGWLRAQGCRRVLAPMNGGAHRSHRFMVRGFDRSPHLFEPRNPERYPRFFAELGFERVHAWHGYELDRAAGERLRRLLRPGVERATREGQVVVTLDPLRSLDRVHRLLDRVWAGHVGYASIDADEFAEVFAGVAALMTERNLGVVVDRAGEDLGVAFTFPDWTDEVRALGGDATRWATWPTRPLPRRLVYHTVAFRPEARRSGAPFLLMDRGLRFALEDGYEELAVALVTEEFRIFERLTAATREYALFGRELDPERRDHRGTETGGVTQRSS